MVLAIMSPRATPTPRSRWPRPAAPRTSRSSPGRAHSG